MFLCLLGPRPSALAQTGSPLAPDQKQFVGGLSSLSLPQISWIKVLLTYFLLFAFPPSTSQRPVKTKSQNKIIRVGDFDVRRLWNWL